jgi:hypothetical protein
MRQVIAVLVPRALEPAEGPPQAACWRRRPRLTGDAFCHCVCADDHAAPAPGRSLHRGGGGADELRGKGGDDTLRGGRGKDELRGGRGSYKCRGGGGWDSKQRC